MNLLNLADELDGLALLADMNEAMRSNKCNARDNVDWLRMQQHKMQQHTAYHRCCERTLAKVHGALTELAHVAKLAELC